VGLGNVRADVQGVNNSVSWPIFHGRDDEDLYVKGSNDIRIIDLAGGCMRDMAAQ
jgi:hypothetical protein